MTTASPSFVRRLVRPLAVGLGVGLAACNQAAPPEQTAPPLPVAVVDYHAALGPLPSIIRQTAERRKTPILYFYAEWCGPCRRFRSTLVEPEVQRALSQATLIKINVDSSQTLAARYAVQAVPTFVKVDAAGEPLATITGDAWAADVPAEIAPAMARFVAGSAAP